MEESQSTVADLRDLIETYLRPEIRPVTEPDTQTVAPVIIDRGEPRAIPEEAFDAFRASPKRRRGAASFTKIEGLIDHINRFKDADSAIFAADDRSKPSLTAVLDYHRAGADASPRFGVHRSVFRFSLSDEWTAWTRANKAPMPMAKFAAFLEDRIIEVIDPSAGDPLPEELQKYIALRGGKVATGAKLVELSRGMHVFENAVVGETVNLASGEGVIEFRSEHVDAKGRPLNVPGLFLIAIPVFRHGDLYRIAARLCYRKTGEGLVFWFELWRADQAFDDAFANACERVRTETELPLFFGTPE